MIPGDKRYSAMLQLVHTATEYAESCTLMAFQHRTRAKTNRKRVYVAGRQMLKAMGWKQPKHEDIVNLLAQCGLDPLDFRIFAK